MFNHRMNSYDQEEKEKISKKIKIMNKNRNYKGKNKYSDNKRIDFKIDSFLKNALIKKYYNTNKYLIIAKK